MAHEKDAPERLIRFREERGIPQRAAAKALGVSHVVYREYESGALTPHVVMREAITRWTHGYVPEDAWPVSDREQHVIEAAARVVPYEPPTSKADESGAIAAGVAHKTG